MKIILFAAAMAFAAPAFAQTAAPAEAHADHGSMDHAKHEGHDGGCCEKDADGKMACCKKMKAEGKKMACCEETAKDKAADAHAGHDMKR